MSLDRLKRLCFSDLDALWARDFFQQAFGYYCVDQDEVSGELPDPSAHFYRLTGRENVWPYEKYGGEYDLDTLVEVIEALHDLVSEPVEGRYHSFNDCGWHYETFDLEAGRREFRAQVNDTLRLAEPALRLQENGEVVLLHSEELEKLLNAPLPPGDQKDDLVVTKIADARQLFRSRHSDVGDRRRAVRELADVLEAIRPDVKTELLSGDERDLFNIANNFAIRHNNTAQKREYGELWIGYIFQLFLANVHLVLRLRERRAQPDSK
ncbi:MAG TPA: hypothetical protein VND98_10605 [Solirubrobacterales bacterium]|nr:hypothetical protein [Solirubrobacterales bacterium]